MVGPKASDAALESVRRDVAEIDRAIVLLVAARVETAGEAIRLRVQRGGRVANPEQEDRVILRARCWAEQLGISPEVVEVVFRTMVEYGKERYRERRSKAPDPVRSSARTLPPGRKTGHLPARRAPRPVTVPTA